MTCLCPHCGYDLAQDDTITAGGLVFDPRGPVTLHGQPVNLTTRQREVFHAILKARGRCVSREAIAERLGYEGDHNLVQVLVSKIRTKLGPSAPQLVTEWGRGYRWAA